MPGWVARRPLAWIALCLAAGVAGSDLGVTAALLVGLACVLVALLAARKALPVAVIGLLFFAAGLIRAVTAFQPGPDDIALLGEVGPVRITGAVISDVVATAYHARFTMQAERAALNGGTFQPASGRLRVRLRLLPPAEPPRYGDRIEATGYLEPLAGRRNPGGFDAEAYYGRQGIRAQLEVTSTADCERIGRAAAPWALVHRLAYAARESFVSSMRRLLPKEHAELMTGVVLGAQADLSAEIRHDFAVTGTAHVLAASGMNVGLIAVGTTLCLGFLGMSVRRAMPYATAVAFVYTLAAGASPSVFRAFMMWVLFAGAHLLEREPDLMNIVGAAAVLQLSLNPGALYDAGFQLSYAIVIALALAAPWIGSLLRENPEPPEPPRWWRRPVAWAAGITLVTLIAQAAAAPITAYHFNQVPALGLLANVLIVWTCAPLMAIGLTLWPLAWALPGMAEVLAALGADPLLRWMLGVVQVAASMPLASLVVPTPPAWLALVTLLAILVMIGAIARARARAESGPTRRRLVPVLAVLAAGSAWIWWVALRPVAEELTVTFLDVGQGDATLIQARNGGTMLVDCGPYGGTRSDSGQRVVIPAMRSMGIGRLDVLALTHADTDHIGGAISLLKGLKVRRLLVTGAPSKETAYLNTLDAARKRGVPVSEVRRGQRIRLSPTVVAEVLHPPPGRISPAKSDNTNSMVISVRCGKTAILLMGDADAEAEMSMVSARLPLRADVLKLGHHGSRSSTTETLLSHVQPRYAVVSAGRRNAYGHPSKVVLERLERKGIKIFRTDTQGSIRVVSNGARLRVEPALNTRPSREARR